MIIGISVWDWGMEFAIEHWDWEFGIRFGYLESVPQNLNRRYTFVILIIGIRIWDWVLDIGVLDYDLEWGIGIED